MATGHPGGHWPHPPRYDLKGRLVVKRPPIPTLITFHIDVTIKAWISFDIRPGRLCRLDHPDRPWLVPEIYIYRR